jgi:hypothetical protein
MSENKHTEGPWTVGCSMDERTSLTRGEYVVFPLPEDDEIEANARLIAAAPDLLALARVAADNADLVTELLCTPGAATMAELVSLVTSLGRRAREAIANATEGESDE